jgi:hypothetical protein
VHVRAPKVFHKMNPGKGLTAVVQLAVLAR